MPVQERPEINGFELKLSNHHYFFHNNIPPFNITSSASIAQNKYATNKLLESAGIPVPKGITLHVDEYDANTIKAMIDDLTFPLVIKPLGGSLGSGVLCNILTIEALNHFLPLYFASYDDLIIEEFHGKLKSYRILVFHKKVIGIVLRHPASVQGDGKHNISELIALTNIQRNEINKELGPITIDEESLIKFKELGITEAYIPADGELITLCYTSNATRGGTFESLKTKICRKNRRLMARIASLMNLNLLGIDVECVDINIPIEDTDGVIIEVNHKPSVRVHELPMSGNAILVTKKIMRSFIFRHPLSYLYSLYTNKKTAFYLRGVTLLGVLGVIYKLITL